MVTNWLQSAAVPKPTHCTFLNDFRFKGVGARSSRTRKSSEVCIPCIFCRYPSMKAEAEVDKQASEVHNHLRPVERQWTTSIPLVNIHVCASLRAFHRAGWRVGGLCMKNVCLPAGESSILHQENKSFTLWIANQNVCVRLKLLLCLDQIDFIALLKKTILWNRFE